VKQDGLISARNSASAEVSGLEIAKPRVSFYTQYGKRMFDLAFAILLLPLLLPIMLVITLGMAHKGKIIFGHRRVGRGGKEFTCYKFRTMIVDADRQLAELLASDTEASAEWEGNHKLKNDPRITRLGHVLRSTSLDELPQLWNVIRGEMSFVGPRPVTRGELEKYGEHTRAYLSVCPGITGPWQVTGRGASSYSDRVLQDAAYVASINFTWDAKIIAQTAFVPLKLTGQ
jgi:lipopolysaccharide/colanic/teichoic acid biosynthesis glycosyltransferase